MMNILGLPIITFGEFNLKALDSAHIEPEHDSIPIRSPAVFHQDKE